MGGGERVAGRPESNGQGQQVTRVCTGFELALLVVLVRRGSDPLFPVPLPHLLGLSLLLTLLSARANLSLRLLFLLPLPRALLCMPACECAPLPGKELLHLNLLPPPLSRSCSMHLALQLFLRFQGHGSGDVDEPVAEWRPVLPPSRRFRVFMPCSEGSVDR